MARIRTIKPEFFQHEALFELEESSMSPMRVAFAGLWTQADREGRFRWRPRQLKTQILPYDNVDFGVVLDRLQGAGFIGKYEIDGEIFGYIPSWSRHQVINNRETASSLPSPDDLRARSVTSTRKSRVSNASATRDGRGQHACSGEGKEGRERNRKGKGIKPPAQAAPSRDERFRPFVEALDKYWKFKNPGVALTFGVAEGKQLKNLLAANRGLTLEQFRVCLNHRSRSDVVHSEPPRKWLASAVSYIHGPLDKYGKPIGAGDGRDNEQQVSAAEKRFRSIAETTARAFERVAGRIPADDKAVLRVRDGDMAQGPVILPPERS